MNDTAKLPAYRVTILVYGDEPNFEEYAREDGVLSVEIEHVGEYDPDRYTVTDSHTDETIHV